LRHPGKTRPFRGPDGEVLSGSIAEVAYRRLGGLDQWVMIRGESVANPPLILLHGGPGWSETGFFRRFNASLEKDFTAVYWDQRGAGKSFDRAIPESSMTVEQFISDLDELAGAVCERLGADNWLSRFEGQMRPRALWKLGQAVLGGQESSILELPRAMRGFRWSMDAMWPEVSRLNLVELVPLLRMPVFFFLGREDHFVPPDNSVAYFNALDAPSKKLVWFEDSGHEPFFDEPDKFNAAVTQLVRPVVAP